MHTHLREDWHVHSTFSDGRHTIHDNARMAERLGLERLGCVDHVRRDSDWLPRFVWAVHQLQRDVAVELHVGIEAKILDERGNLDVPDSLVGVDRIYAADHRFPIGDEALSPREVKARFAAGTLTPEAAIESLLRATANAVERYPNVVVAHLFSVLPKVGLSEADVSDEALRSLAAHVRRCGAIVEIDERWCCPAPRTVRAFLEAGCGVVGASDAHRADHIGRFRYVSWALENALSPAPAADGARAFRAAGAGAAS